MIRSIQSLLVNDRFDSVEGIPEAKLRERCQVLIDRLAWLDILKDARGEQIVKMSTDIGDRSIQIGKAQIPFDIYGYGVENAGLPGLTSDDIEFLPSFPDIQKEYPNARVSPSALPYDPDDAGEDELKTVEVFGQRIKIIGSPEMDVLGSAVHSYFAVDYECLAADNQTNLARNIIKNWSMSPAFTDQPSAVSAYSEILS